jgi:hypothetical protein
MSCQFLEFFWGNLIFMRIVFFCFSGRFTTFLGFPHVSIITFTSPNTYDISFQWTVWILVNHVAQLINTLPTNWKVSVHHGLCRSKRPQLDSVLLFAVISKARLHETCFVFPYAKAEHDCIERWPTTDIFCVHQAPRRISSIILSTLCSR